jgi:hypothetical protein
MRFLLAAKRDRFLAIPDSWLRQVARIRHIDRRTESVVDTDAEKSSNSAADFRAFCALSQA